jgi:hypothetical protein
MAVLEVDAPAANEVASAANGTKQDPWILYREQYRRETSEDLVFERKVKDFDDKLLKKDNEAAFEIRRTYRVRDTRNSGKGESEASLESTATAASAYLKPKVTMHLNSVALCHALRSVVRYYPEQDLGGESIEIAWPYPVLAHHYEKLEAYRAECIETRPDELCERKVDADTHIRLLLEYLDRHIMTEVRAEQARGKELKQTWDWLWVSQVPGRLMLFRYSRDEIWQPAIIHSVSGGTFTDPPDRGWSISYWNLHYSSGEYVGRRLDRYRNVRYDGESSLEMLPVDISEKIERQDLKELIKQGEVYWKLLKKQCMYHNGKTKKFPYNHVSLWRQQIPEADCSPD